MSAEELSDRTGTGSEEVDATELAARVEILAEENRRLREEYARARRARYRRTALGLITVGVVGVLGGLAFPEARTVLFALGATGVFAGLLTYYLTPERFVPVTIGEAVYGALAANGAAIAAELGLHDDRVYVPVDTPTEDPARLFVPQHAEYGIPETDELTTTFVVTGDDRRRGVSFSPTGGALFREFERVLTGPLSDDPGPLADQLADGVIEGFELARSATPEVDADAGRVTVGIDDSAFGSVDRFDHPIASFLGVGFAVGLDQPVTVEVTAADDDRYDYLVACTWSPAGTDGESDG